MTPFYIWFACTTSFLVAATLVGTLPVTLPVPWTGLALVTAVMSVSILPFFYGQIFVRDVCALERREACATNGGSDGAYGGRSSRGYSNGVGRGGGVDDEGDAGGETLPLLGTVDGTAVVREDIESHGMTWKECLQVRSDRVCNDGVCNERRDFMRGGPP